jgi:hypothetical protein
MPQSTRGPLFDQVESLWRPFAQVPGLPFREVLTAAQVEQAFQAENVDRCDCVSTPLTTVRLLLAQSLDPDPSWLAPILCTRRCESRINRYRWLLGPA